MNKSIYTVINTAFLYPEAQYSSYDKSFLEEIICDEFMFDVMYEFNSRMNGAFTTGEPCKIAKESWNEVLNYYNDYVSIIRSNVI